MESRQVVAFALKVMSNMPPFKGSDASNDFTIDAMEKKKHIEIVRFERRINDLWHSFSVHVKIVGNGDVCCIYEDRYRSYRLKMLLACRRER